MTKQIFISYRRQDSADVTGRIYDQLVDKFGRDTIFKDVDDIPLGIDFKDYLDEIVSQCSVMLVIIGPQWVDYEDEEGNRRLENPEDIVRLEIASALRRDIPIIPLLVSGSAMPSSDDLPEEIARLADRNGTSIRAHRDFHNDMRWLVGHLGRYVTMWGRLRGWLSNYRYVALLISVLALIILGIFVVQRILPGACPPSIGQRVHVGNGINAFSNPAVESGTRTHIFSRRTPVYIIGGKEWGNIVQDSDTSGWWWEISETPDGESLGWVWEGQIEECE